MAKSNREVPKHFKKDTNGIVNVWILQIYLILKFPKL